MFRNDGFNSKFILLLKITTHMKNLTKMTEDSCLGFEKINVNNQSKSMLSL